jgi:signal transduction histidine kinase
LADPSGRWVLYDCSVIRSTLRNAIREPRVADAPRRVWRDRLVVGLFIPAAFIEVALRDTAGWKPAAFVSSFVLAAAIYWRRTHPLVATVVVFGSIVVLDTISRMVADQPLEFYTSVVLLIVPYALFRWGSGREAAIGLGIMLAMLVNSFIQDWTGLGDFIGGTLVLLFPAELGIVIRYQQRSRLQSLEEVKLREREQLARELHDTVAHHVSAIAIQAQAGRAVAATRPNAALEALAIIEEEASRTLIEMRTMVGALRAGDEADLAPAAGVADINRLAESSVLLEIVVEYTGDLDNISPPLDRALFRLAQESITNATRHARNASGVTVTLDGDRDHVQLTVVDDGERQSFDAESASGFGLVGMTERANLLGGTFDAGPNPRRGWTVKAVLPKGTAVVGAATGKGGVRS